MTVYLFSDIFKNFKRFFNIDNVKESHFLYDITFGFMPRKFECNDEDKIIYDEEDEVPEMYFMTEGIIGIGFSVVANGMTNDPYFITKKLQCVQNVLICDHYVVNLCKSQFIYMALNKDVKGFALTKKFLHETVFPKYPHITSKMQAESMRLYKKTIFKPVNDERKIKIQQLNKKSVYRQIQFIDKDTNIKESQYNSKQDALGHEKNKILAEKIIS